MDNKRKRQLIQLSLFVITVITTTLAGSEWTIGAFVVLGMSWDDFLYGLHFSLPFLGILTVHEFGHYFTAKYHKIRVSLPYYIPMWFGFIGMPTIGTMGAFIRIREHISSRKHYFDVGVSGPVAGFVVAVICLIYGFKTLPETEYIFEVHPEYEVFGENFEEKMQGLDTIILKTSLDATRMGYKNLPDTIYTNRSGTIAFGDNLLMKFGRTYLAPDDRYVPGPKELMHYPYLLAAFLAFFFTALNLLPIGQLDGGHVIFGLFGPKNHYWISRIFFTGFVFYAGLGWLTVADLENSSSEALLNFLISLFAYLFILYLCAYSVFKEIKDRLLYATVVLTCQFIVSSFLQVEGYSGWLLFSVLIGRFIGVDHPPVVFDSPLSMERKLLGWIALIIFVLCFSPQPLVVDGY